MNRIVPSALAAAAIALLSGCAADATQSQQPADKYLDASYTPTGTLIPRKASKGAGDNVTIVDKQALENDRNNNNGTNNWAGAGH
ncbi:hypothetical protein HAV22_19805 [Massilia sp. TW-1]|uniref:Lipoprotein n=1 Tax=Telluria antibiotica TaxID=2717319 RepID=A0ABX0PET2_9BURK|nr:hypothetical protein [Telluria antibiotica]NIA55882.1 hypothetical protein [Telluria antibiotica]